MNPLRQQIDHLLVPAVASGNIHYALDSLIESLCSLAAGAWLNVGSNQTYVDMKTRLLTEVAIRLDQSFDEFRESAN